MVHGDLAPERVLELAARAGAVVAGPGLGRTPEARALVDGLVRGVAVPLVLDADALYALAERLETLVERPAPTALTPHAGELAGCSAGTAAQSRHRLAASAGGRASGAAVLLKGPDTLVAAPASRCAWSRRGCRRSPPPVPATCSPEWPGACARGLPPAKARRSPRWRTARRAAGAAAHGTLLAADLERPLGRLLA